MTTPLHRTGEPTAPSETADPMRQIVDRVREITRENERLFARLIEGERRFRTLAKAVWKVQEDERRRLAREVHDGLGQTLTALTHQLERLQRKVDGDEIGERLADSVELARLALNETRELSRLLRPTLLDDLGLPAALAWLARTLGERTGLSVELALDRLEERLDPDLETLIFRLTQEALTNVLRHSGVSSAKVVVSYTPAASIGLQVADGGRGFDVPAVLAAHEAGSGLRGMRDRVELFGGRFELVSAPGEGTLVVAVVPLLEGP